MESDTDLEGSASLVWQTSIINGSQHLLGPALPQSYSALPAVLRPARSLIRWALRLPCSADGEPGVTKAKELAQSQGQVKSRVRI